VQTKGKSDTKAGVNIYESRTDLGIDMAFSKVGRRKAGRRKEDRYTDTSSLMLTSQLKSSTLWEVKEDTIAYDLKVKNYNDLVESDVCVLILMCLPPTPDEWLHQDEECLQLCKCCYYWRPLDNYALFHMRHLEPCVSDAGLAPLVRVSRLCGANTQGLWLY
jgi:hypothetical protein